MSKVKDSAIKLFGRTISLPLGRDFAANGSSATAASVDDCSDHINRSSSSSPPEEESSGTEGEAHGDDTQEASRKELTSVQEDVATHQTSEDAKSTTTITASSGIFDNPKTSSSERQNSVPKSSKNGEQSETSVSQEKTLKKPDKILPCQRCNSMDTKFCYYNNYNVNQPRHFCKNCQRYWTAGGTMRNVPVGAGRRKNKNSSASSHYQHIMLPEALQTTETNALHNAVLTFGSDSPLCNSMASVLNLAEKTQHGVLNIFHLPEKNIVLSSGREDNGDNYSLRASFATSASSERRANAGMQESPDKNYQGFPSLVPSLPGSTWPYPWNSTQWSSSAPPPAILAGYSVSFYPTSAYRACAAPTTWNMSCISPQSSITNSSHSSRPNSPYLGKHSREGNILRPACSQKERPDKESSSSENSVLIPKTLRIDDPGEAAKSSIWSTLEIKNEKANSLNGMGVCKAFPSKEDGKNHVLEALPVLQANPAAWSRSLTFQERT